MASPENENAADLPSKEQLHDWAGDILRLLKPVRGAPIAEKQLWAELSEKHPDMEWEIFKKLLAALEEEKFLKHKQGKHGRDKYSISGDGMAAVSKGKYSELRHKKESSADAGENNQAAQNIVETPLPAKSRNKKWDEEFDGEFFRKLTKLDPDKKTMQRLAIMAVISQYPDGIPLPAIIAALADGVTLSDNTGSVKVPGFNKKLRHRLEELEGGDEQSGSKIAFLTSRDIGGEIVFFMKKKGQAAMDFRAAKFIDKDSKALRFGKLSATGMAIEGVSNTASPEILEDVRAGEDILDLDEADNVEAAVAAQPQRKKIVPAADSWIPVLHRAQKFEDRTAFAQDHDDASLSSSDSSELRRIRDAEDAKQAERAQKQAAAKRDQAASSALQLLRKQPQDTSFAARVSPLSPSKSSLDRH